MKYLILLIIIFTLGSCVSKKENNAEGTKADIGVDSFLSRKIPDTVTTKQSPVLKVEPTKQEPLKKIGAHPADGKYRYDMAFAEYQGKSMGEKVTVIIKGDSIKIIYEGDGKLTVAKGAILSEGIIVKHKSGVWIIARNIKDAALDEFGGCSGGPPVIDFTRKKYITC